MYDTAAQSRLVARPVPHRRRHARGHPPEHVRAQEHPRHAGREPRVRRQHAAGRGHAARQPQPQVVRVALGGVQHARVLLDEPGEDPRGSSQDSIAYQSANVGRIVLRGSYPWGLHPRFPVHDLPDFDDDPADNPDPSLPNQSTSGNLRNTDYVNPARIIEPAPCGYFVTETQYSGPAPGIGPPLAVRLDAHGVAQETRPSGHIVRLAQPLRGLIPMLLDASTLPPIEPPAPSERSCTARGCSSARTSRRRSGATRRRCSRGRRPRTRSRSGTSLPRSTSR